MHDAGAPDGGGVARPVDSGRQASALRHRFTNIVRVAQVDSTNRLAAELCREGAGEGLVVVADEQVAGRGRRGRRWDAPAGSSLLSSIVLRPPDPEEAHLCVAAVALAACAALADVAGCEAALKWPNDLVVESADGDARKLAGVLAEWIGDGLLVVGIGCNLAWPSDAAMALPETATTVAALTGESPGREAVLAALLVELEARYSQLGREGAGAGALAAERRARCVTIGRMVRVEGADGAVRTGRAIDVADDGRLVLEEPGGACVALAEGDVVHVRAAPGA